MAMVNINDFQNLVKESDFGISASHTGYDNNQRAFIYFFTPRKVPDVTVRPYDYRFDGVFIDDIQRVVSGCYNDHVASIGGNSFQNAYMPGIDSANRAVVPNAHGQFFSGSYFDHMWTFLLVIDNAPLKGRVRTSPLNNRLIYTGFCMEEPAINQFSMIGGSSTILNPNCLLIPTHFTQMNIKHIITPSGGVFSPILEQDTDIVHPDFVLSSNPNRDRTYLLRPEDVVNTSGVTPDGYSYSVPELASIENRASTVTLDTITKSPKQHLHQLVSGMTKYLLDREASNLVSSDVNDYNVYSFDPGTDYQRIKDNMTTRVSDRILGIRLDQPIALADVLSEFPILNQNAQIIDIPFNFSEDPMSDIAANPINIYSSLINSSISAIFPRYGISDVMFRYASFNPLAISQFDAQSACQVFDIQTFMPGESSEVIQLRWKNALNHLEQHIFPIILANVGNFDVMISYRSSGECFCQLQLVDMTDTINDGKIMTNGLFGGLQTPLIGSFAQRENNETQLMETINYIRGTNINDLPNAEYMYNEFNPNNPQKSSTFRLFQ